MFADSSLLEDDLKEPFTAWKSTPGPDSNATFLKTLDPTIRGAIQTHVGESHPGIYSRARQMTLEGLNSYDPSRGRLKTHLYNHLQGLKRVSRNQTQIMAVPERIQFDRFHLQKAESDLTNDLGRTPTTAELADRTGFSRKRLQRVRQYVPAVAESMMQDRETGDAYGGGVRADSPASAWLELVYDDMDPYHQTIMEHTLGMFGQKPMSNQALAVKLRRSPGAISQAKARIQAALDEEADISPFL